MCGLKTAIHGADVVALWRRHRDLWGGDLGGDECVGGEGLLFSGFCEVGVCPGYGAVPFEFGPVGVPGRGPVEGFGDVVGAFAVAAHVEEFVGCGGGAGGD